MSKRTELKRQARYLREKMESHYRDAWEGDRNGLVTTIKPDGQTITQERYADVWQRGKILIRDGGMCRYCGDNVTLETAVFDHVKPYKHGGQTNLDNLVTSCTYCNGVKLNRQNVEVPDCGNATNPFSKPKAPLT